MKRRIRQLLQIAGWGLLLAFLVITLSFTSKEITNIECAGVAVRFSGKSDIRLDKESLVRMILSADNQLIGKKMNEINTEAIEAELSKNRAVLKADLFKSVIKDSTGWKGIVTLKVKHRIPVVRVITSTDNYYLDANGHVIPPSVHYAADVPVATGIIGGEAARHDLLSLINYLKKDKFWSAQIKQIHLTRSGEILFSTLVGDQLIEFGSVGDMDEKFRNLRAFYDQVLVKGNWHKYKSVSVKYKNQVVAKKQR